MDRLTLLIIILCWKFKMSISFIWMRWRSDIYLLCTVPVCTVCMNRSWVTCLLFCERNTWCQSKWCQRRLFTWASAPVNMARLTVSEGKTVGMSCTNSPHCEWFKMFISYRQSSLWMVCEGDAHLVPTLWMVCEGAAHLVPTLWMVCESAAHLVPTLWMVCEGDAHLVPTLWMVCEGDAHQLHWFL